MKKCLFFLALVLLVAGCKKNEGVAPIHVQINDFTVTQEDITRNEVPVVDYQGVKAITLAFYEGTTEVYKTTQFRADASTFTTFGTFDCTLGIGSYTMVVLAYGSENEITLTSPTSAAYTTDKCRETFAYTQTVNVTTTAAINLGATLDRVISKVKVQSIDNQVLEARKVNLTFSAGGISFNPTTGLATSNTGLTNEITIAAASGGTTYFTSYLFLASDEQTVNVTIDILDEDDATLYHKVVNNVPLKRNRMTVLRGQLFSSSSSGQFFVESDWEGGDDLYIDIDP